jgi:hypothetical protein
VHEHGFRVERQPDGELPHAPALLTVPPDGLTSEHAAARLSVNGSRLTATGTGERLDLGDAIDVLHPRAMGSSTPFPLRT